MSEPVDKSLYSRVKSRANKKFSSNIKKSFFQQRQIEKTIAIYEKAHREHTEIRHSKTEWDNV